MNLKLPKMFDVGGEFSWRVRKNFLQLGIFFLIMFLKEVFSNRDVLGGEVGSSWSADPLES